MKEEQRNMENEIRDGIRVFDRFEHPAVSEEFAKELARSMARTYRRGRTVGLIFRIGAPLAAAALLVLTFTLFFQKDEQTTVSPTVNREIASIWSLTEQEEREMVFADLDFSTATSQPTSKSSTSDETIDEMNKTLLEVMNLS